MGLFLQDLICGASEASKCLCCVSGANGFLQTVHRNMTSKLLQLPDKHSVTELLNTWAQSVRQACLSAA